MAVFLAQKTGLLETLSNAGPIAAVEFEHPLTSKNEPASFAGSFHFVLSVLQVDESARKLMLLDSDSIDLSADLFHVPSLSLTFCNYLILIIAKNY